MGPLTMSTIADPPVLLAGPWYEKSGWQRLFTAATTTGAYAGRQPAMTALMARLSAVTTALRPWISPTISSPRSPALLSIAATLVSLGGTTGKPSVHPAS